MDTADPTEGDFPQSDAAAKEATATPPPRSARTSHLEETRTDGAESPGNQPISRTPEGGEPSLDDSDSVAATLWLSAGSPSSPVLPDRQRGRKGIDPAVTLASPGGPSLGMAVGRQGGASPAESRERALPAVPGYTLLGELGRGGMGVVYKARQDRLKRPCVLKMILAGAHASPGDIARFLAEAEAVARLQHPNIVQIHHIGEADGLPFFELEYIQGGSLDRRLDGTPWPASRAAKLVSALAEGMAEAHRLGTVHRDLKPGNVLLTLDGTPKITDFGLAKSLSTDAGLTQTNTIMGSPGYMAPEQAAGKSKEVGPLADVYALGAILYELLTGRPPFRGATVLDTLAQVRSADPVPLSRLVAGLPRDLETIALRCLQKEPAKRYGSAAALAEDLRRFQAGETILARRTSAIERGWRWGKRNPVVAGALAATLAALLSVAVLAVVHADNQARFARDQAAAAAQISELARDLDLERSELATSLAESNRRLAALNLERGRSACERGSIGPGLLQMVESLRVATEAGDPAWGHAALANLSAWRRHYPELRQVFSPGGAVTTVAMSPDGKTVLTCGDRFVRSWDAATGRPGGLVLEHPSPVHAIAYSPDGQFVLTGCADWRARIWDARTGQLVGQPLLHQSRVLAVAFSPDGTRIATGCSDHAARVWDTASRRTLGQPLQHELAVFSVAFGPEGKSILTGSMDWSARLWDTETGRPLGPPLPHQNWIHAVAISPDGRTILTCSEDQTARLWDAATGQPIGQPLEHNGRVYAAAFSPDGRTFATAGEDRVAHLWDTATARPVGRSLEHQGIIRAVAFGPDGRMVLTGSDDHTARLWDLKTGLSIGKPLDQSGKVAAVAYSRDGTFFLTGSEDHTARLWDAVTGEPRSPSLRHGGRVHAVAICPDGKTFLTGSGDGTAQEWRSATGEKKGPALEHKGAVLAVAYSPDGGTILTGSEDGTARLWHAATGQLLGEALTHEGPVQTVAFSSDGTKVLTGSADRTARLWDVSSARPISSPLAHPGPVRHVLFSPDERMILSACDDHEIRRWNLDNGQPLDPPLVHEGPILAVAFSPDGQRILTTSEDKTARLWDAVTGLPVGSPLRHPNSVFAGVFSPDGKTVLTGSLDSAARLWDAVTGEPIGAPLGGHLYAVDLVAYGPDGGSILTASQDGTVRLWDAAELPDDLETLRVWVSAETGLELDEQGSIRVLEAPAWRERGARLSQLGDLRESRGDRFLDPILFGQDPASRARALAARGSEQDAEAAFDETVAMRPRHHLTFIERGRFHAAAGRTEKAAEDFSQGLALIAENRFWDSPRSRIIKELAPWEEAFDHLLRLEPEDDHLWIVRGRHRVLLSRFYQAAEDFARGIDSSPPESEEWFEHAGLCWLTGDYDGFRRFVLDMSEKGGTAPEPIVAYVMARSCNVSPEQVIDPAQVIRWADLAVNAERSAWYLHALGGAYYRAGQFAKAIEVLEESTASGWDEEGKAQNRLLLAMACLKTGDRPKARALVHEVDRWWATVETNRKGGAVALSAAGWIALNVLRREVEAILADGVFPSDPFAH